MGDRMKRRRIREEVAWPKRSIVFPGPTLTLTVTGEFVPPEPAVISADPDKSSPPEGGYIDDPRVLLHGVDVSDLLDGAQFDEITAEAYQKALEAIR
jgi:hypothetical protein